MTSQKDLPALPSFEDTSLDPFGILIECGFEYFQYDFSKAGEVGNFGFRRFGCIAQIKIYSVRVKPVVSDNICAYFHYSYIDLAHSSFDDNDMVQNMSRPTDVISIYSNDHLVEVLELLEEMEDSVVFLDDFTLAKESNLSYYGATTSNSFVYRGSDIRLA